MKPAPPDHASSPKFSHSSDDWGLDLLADKMRGEMEEELGHSDEYMARLFFLKESPEMKFDKLPQRAQTLKDMFEADLADEKEAIEFYTKAAIEASNERDLGTRQLFEETAIDEEHHMSWLELQLDLLLRMGEPAYISKHMPAPGTATTT